MAAATIVDVAAEAGVSKTTASDALRGRGRVSDATRDAVLAAAERLGYTLNRSARSLRTSMAGAIGLYLPQVLVRSQYYHAFLHGVANEAAAAEYDVTLIFSGLRPLTGYAPHVDGIVVCDAREDDPMIDRLRATGLPLVSLEPIPGGVPADGMVWTDAVGVTNALLDELWAAGSRQPAMLSTTTPALWPRDAERAFDRWCAAHGVEPIRSAADYGADARTLQAAAGGLLDRRSDIDSIVCVGDGVAARLAPGIAERGYRLGEDFRLASCSEQVVEAPLFAAVDTSADRAGAECARLLLEIIRGDIESGARRQHVIEVKKPDADDLRG